jgi:hypothetical protein
MRPIVALLTLLLAGIASAQDPPPATAGAQIRFTVENHQLDPSAYTLEINKDGSGIYTASFGGGDVTPQAEKRAIQIREPLLSQLFESAQKDHFFATECEAPHNHVAFTGKKTLAYTGPDGKGSCTFNYSRDQSLNQLAYDLMSVAYTLEEGTRLKSEHLHDRLSLDGELESLGTAAQDHRALDLENIAPELEGIANDDAVMERARTRARALLSEPASAH